LNEPVVSNLCVKICPWPKLDESHWPPSAVDVWLVESLLPHVTVVPVLIVSVAGVNAVEFAMSTVVGPAGMGVGVVGEFLHETPSAANINTTNIRRFIDRLRR
jgi:hypothetical protein